MSRLLVIDNYDSFTYNLVHALKELGQRNLVVKRNDKISCKEVAEFDKILLSPGPGLPSEAGIMPELIETFASSKSILGICLGHQGIAEAFGGRLVNLEKVMHGQETDAKVIAEDEVLFSNIPELLRVGRYHSWVVEAESLPDCFRITASTDDGQIMGLSHKEFDVKGLQFHPESVMTELGSTILKNWIEK